MKSKKLNEAFQYVDDNFLDIAELERCRRRRKQKSVWHYGSIVAACICLMLIVPIGVVAADWFGLRSLLLPGISSEVSQDEESGNVDSEGQGSVSGLDTQVGEEAFVAAPSTDMIGLAGYIDSPEAQALNEWQTFLAGYDTDGAIIEQIGNNPTNLDSRYDLYYVYTQEMADKLDEIVTKYNLKLHTEMNVVSQEELDYRVGGDFLQEEMNRAWAYIYEDGTFQFDGNITLDSCGYVDYQFRRTVKGTFDEVVLNIGHAVNYQEFQYVTACGEPVMLALGPNKALIFCDFEECFIALNILGGSENGLTEEDLKKMADAVDFVVLKDVIVPDMRGDSVP